jgi:hypothetical protein
MSTAQAQTPDGFRDGVSTAERVRARLGKGLADARGDVGATKTAASLGVNCGPRRALGYIRDYATSKYAAEDDAGHLRRAGQQGGLVGTVLGITIAAVVAYVGIQVLSRTQDASGIDQSVAENDPANATEFENASLSVTTGVESGMSLLEVVFIVLLLSLIVGALVGLRR